jgi:chaperonin cofactor prefoldin
MNTWRKGEMKADEARITQEISNYEMQLRAAEELKAKVKEATAELEAAYLGIVRAKTAFEGIKKQNLEEVRTYKLAIASECKEIATAMAALSKLADQATVANITAFASACERLANLSEAGFLERGRINLRPQ